MRLNDLLIHDFQLLPPLPAMVAADLPSLAVLSPWGFLHSRKFRAPCDPIVSQGLRAAIQDKDNISEIEFQIDSVSRTETGKKILTIRSIIGAVQQEIIEVGAQNRKPPFSRVRLESCVYDSRHELFLIHNEADRASAAQHGDTDEEPVALRAVILLMLVEQHRAYREIEKTSGVGIFLDQTRIAACRQRAGRRGCDLRGRRRGSGSTSLPCRIQTRRQDCSPSIGEG